MKIRNIFAAIAAVLTLGFVASCDESIDPVMHDVVQPSCSYVTLQLSGSPVTTTINATDSWEIKGVRSWNKNTKSFEYSMPDWVTISPMSGGAGSTTVNISAEASEFGRLAEMAILYGSKSDNEVVFLNVQQGKLETQTAKCSEVIAGADGKTYRVTGKVTKIANTQYGNWYLEDATGEVYIYGTLDKNGNEKNFTSLGIEIGDEVTVEGPKTTYGTTVELVNVTVVKIVKSLIKIMEVSPADATLPSDGGEVTVACQVKGTKGVLLDLTEEQRSWLSAKTIKVETLPNPKDSTLTVDVINVIFSVKPNTQGPRSTEVVLSTADDNGGASSVSVSISQAGLSGTLELPMTVEEAIAAANAGISTPVYVKGIVSKLVDSKNKAGVVVPGFNADYGNGSFWISADGKYNEDLALDFEVYQANWLGGKSWTEENPQIAVGAEVVVYGPLTTYKGTAETQGKGAAHVYSVNGVTSDANGIGSLENPFDAVGGIAAANAGITGNVYVQGIVSKLVDSKNKSGEYVPGFNADYGNGSFWISIDGAFNDDLALDFEAYQVNYLGGEKWTEEDPQIEVGDAVVLYGPLTTYKGTAETQGKGAAYVYCLNPELPTGAE